MIKKTLIATLCVFLISSQVLMAQNHPYFGTTDESQYLWADLYNGVRTFTTISYVSASNSAQMNFYRTIDDSASFISSQGLSNGSGSVTPPASTTAIRLISNDGGEVCISYARTSSGNEVQFDGCSSNNGGDDGGGSGNDCGCIFNTPGWSDYMDRIDDIINAIPSPPNWQQVANTFRDTIVPRFISDLGDLLGHAPNPPSAPAFNHNLTGEIDAPRGQLPSGLDDAGFSADDIRGGAEEIEVREDPTGGFDILDPIGSLPSQDEFKDNIPDEGDMIAPEVPEVDAEAPAAPEEQENIAPSPPDVGGTAPNPDESDNLAPGAPEEQENIAPTPPDVEGTAPSPNEQENMAPEAPDEGDNFAPSPGDGDGTTAPIPGDRDNQAPVPGDGGGVAPIPGSDGGTVPIPGAGNETAPMPGRDNGAAPIPGRRSDE
ncbi:hypothetical protein SAMN04488134_11356 [Amphibacillus marinus]|uniref:Uncharacterized protein n=1 Tax=Amphibacillus marinus TaxID=872970 RepID=A0A1H8SP90_9BACI|nr:hypothetical protein [Amphibacillus marinus]SEO80385.1 hypothetical protein SAMN04488134_11356 [Amphibacillus marinus]